MAWNELNVHWSRLVATYAFLKVLGLSMAEKLQEMFTIRERQEVEVQAYIDKLSCLELIVVTCMPFGVYSCTKRARQCVVRETNVPLVGRVCCFPPFDKEFVSTDYPSFYFAGDYWTVVIDSNQITNNTQHLHKAFSCLALRNKLSVTGVE